MGMTKQRRVILELVSSFDGHPTAEDIYALSQKSFPHISMGTVYRNLNILADTGVIRRVHLPDQPVRFDRDLAPHEHMVCVGCGSIFDVPSVALDISWAIPDGFRVLRHELFIYCVCPDCQDELPL